MSGEITPGNLNIGTWLSQMQSHSNPIYENRGKVDMSLFFMADAKITAIYDECIAAPGTTVGDANLSGDESIMKDFVAKMDAATKKANQKLDEVARELGIQVAENEEAQKTADNPLVDDSSDKDKTFTA